MNMKIHRKVFAFALSAGMVVGVIGGFRVFLILLLIERYGFTTTQCGFYSSILSVVLNILIPIMLLIALYRLGKRIDLRSTYVDVGVSLFIGGALAHCFGYVVGYFLNPIGREFWTSDSTSILVIAATHGLSHGLYLFFLGFTAITLAYFRSREGPSEGVRWRNTTS